MENFIDFFSEEVGEVVMENKLDYSNSYSRLSVTKENDEVHELEYHRIRRRPEKIEICKSFYDVQFCLSLSKFDTGYVFGFDFSDVWECEDFDNVAEVFHNVPTEVLKLPAASRFNRMLTPDFQWFSTMNFFARAIFDQNEYLRQIFDYAKSVLEKYEFSARQLCAGLCLWIDLTSMLDFSEVDFNFFISVDNLREVEQLRSEIWALIMNPYYNYLEISATTSKFSLPRFFDSSSFMFWASIGSAVEFIESYAISLEILYEALVVRLEKICKIFDKYQNMVLGNITYYSSIPQFGVGFDGHSEFIELSIDEFFRTLNILKSTFGLKAESMAYIADRSVVATAILYNRGYIKLDGFKILE